MPCVVVVADRDEKHHHNFQSDLTDLLYRTGKKVARWLPDLLWPGFSRRQSGTDRPPLTSSPQKHHRQEEVAEVMPKHAESHEEMTENAHVQGLHQQTCNELERFKSEDDELHTEIRNLAADLVDVTQKNSSMETVAEQQEIHCLSCKNS